MTQGTPTSQTEPKLKGVQGFFCVDTFGLQKVWRLPQSLDSPFDRPAPRFNGAASVAISCQIKKGNGTTTKYYSSKVLLELIYSIYIYIIPLIFYLNRNLRIVMVRILAFWFKCCNDWFMSLRVLGAYLSMSYLFLYVDMAPCDSLNHLCRSTATKGIHHLHLVSNLSDLLVS